MNNVMYAGNKTVLKGIVLSILSILEHHHEVLYFYILTMSLIELDEKYQGIDEKDIQVLNKLVKNANCKNEVILKDVTSVFKETLSESINLDNFYTPYCLLRLLADKVELPSKILYLDADTMVLNDLKELFLIDIKNYEYAACKDYMGRVFKHPKYINSGVMLLNLDKINETKLFEKTRYYINHKKKAFPDQDALNKFVKYKKIIPMKFNEQRKIKENTVIKHFCKGIKFFPIFKIYNIKQWETDKVHSLLKISQFDKIYEKFEKVREEFKL